MMTLRALLSLATTFLLAIFLWTVDIFYGAQELPVAHVAVSGVCEAFDPEEFRVIEAALKQIYVERRLGDVSCGRGDTRIFVILDHTTDGMPPPPSLPHRDALKYLRSVYDSLPGAAYGTCADFVWKNGPMCPLGSMPDIRLHYALVSESQLKTYFAKGCCHWEDFYERFPSSGGFLMVSRVGLDEERHQAVVSVGSREASASTALLATVTAVGVRELQRAWFNATGNAIRSDRLIVAR